MADGKKRAAKSEGAKKRVRKAKAKKPSAGRPVFAPTEEQRQNVEIWIAGGMGLDEVAHAIGIAENTLKKHFAAEIKMAKSKKRAEVLLAMFNSAKGGNVSAQKAFLALNSIAGAEDEFLNPTKKQSAPANVEKPARVAKLGKKEQADEEAATAGEGTAWGGDLDVTSPPVGVKPN